MSDITADDILQFWFEDIEKSRWFIKDEGFDRDLAKRFGDLHAMACEGALDHWCDSARGRLALIILLDQFSRNMFRGSVAAFESDLATQKLALDGIQAGHDVELTPEERSFLYMPFRHAENLELQQLGLEKTRELNAAGYGSDKYALNHLEIVERFGRFPHRNEILGRECAEEEEAYLAEGNKGF
jgi:uncharacterized protein (DUF924 family)